jgi:hypothetical protein
MKVGGLNLQIHPEKRSLFGEDDGRANSRIKIRPPPRWQRPFSPKSQEGWVRGYETYMQIGSETSIDCKHSSFMQFFLKLFPAINHKEKLWANDNLLWANFLFTVRQIVIVLATSFPRRSPDYRPGIVIANWDPCNYCFP